MKTPLDSSPSAVLLPLVPYPAVVRYLNGVYALRSEPIRGTLDDLQSPAIAYRLTRMGLAAQPSGEEPLVLHLGTPQKPAPAAPRRAEAYAMRIDAGGVTIRGHDPAGLHWGLTTLHQLINNGDRLPALEIEDFPAFAVRGHHDDVSRKQISTVADFQDFIRTLSDFKINLYSPYLEDMVHLGPFPAIGEGRGKLMPEEIEAIRDEARRCGVQLMPSFTLIGHQENLLADFRFAHLAKSVFQSPSSFDPDKGAVRRFLEVVIEEVCRLFPDSPWLNACFDETQGLTEEEFVGHANWCAAQLAARGKRMLMWVDMFKNHFGIEKIHDLHPNILPIEWDYGDPLPNAHRYREARLAPVGYAGYGTWCAFLPDGAAGRKNIDRWAEAMSITGGPGWICSQWGDNGYENSRHLPWNSMAYQGERAWCGVQATDRFEDRFETVFYGLPLPLLQQDIKSLANRRQISPGLSWTLFRESQAHLVRRCTHDPALAGKAAHDLELYATASAALAECRSQVRRQAGHLDHFEVALLRDRLIARRLVLAGRQAQGGATPAVGAEEIAALLAENERVRERYASVWLRHNKRPNLEVSLAVYDNVAASLRAFLAAPPAVRPEYLELELPAAQLDFFAAVAGTPLGRGRVHGIPFQFVPACASHCPIAPGQTVAFDFAPRVIRDLHLLGAGQTLIEKDYSPFLKVTLFLEGRPVFTETLLNVRHICCWWAPLGEHMWAGGGYRHCDQRRNHWALVPGTMYGLTRLSGFPIPPGLCADRLELAACDRETYALFALTIETE